jgi:hypothetical protein
MIGAGEIQRVNGLAIADGRIASLSVPWPLLALDIDRWLQLLPTLHEINQEQAMFEGDRALEAQERSRGAAALRCLEQGVVPSPDEHPFLALRMLCHPFVVCACDLEHYIFSLAELYPGPGCEPFFVVDCRDGVLHLVRELEFLGDLIGPGMLSTTAPAEWLAEYVAQLQGRHHAAVVAR